MRYDTAITKAWDELLDLHPAENLSVTFLGNEFSIDTVKRKVISVLTNDTAKDYETILILHYLASEIKGLPEVSGEWLSFKELSAIEGYQPVFRKRVIERIIKKYTADPDALFSVLDRIPGKKIQQADIAVVLEVFDGVPLLIELWKADEEFSPEANVLFDKSVTGIFCIEDIIVLAELTVGKL